LFDQQFIMPLRAEDIHPSELQEENVGLKTPV
jgi:hypothetical protein